MNKSLFTGHFEDVVNTFCFLLSGRTYIPDKGSVLRADKKERSQMQSSDHPARLVVVSLRIPYFFVPDPETWRTPRTKTLSPISQRIGSCNNQLVGRMPISRGLDGSIHNSIGLGLIGRDVCLASLTTGASGRLNESAPLGWPWEGCRRLLEGV